MSSPLSVLAALSLRIYSSSCALPGKSILPSSHWHRYPCLRSVTPPSTSTPSLPPIHFLFAIQDSDITPKLSWLPRKCGTLNWRPISVFASKSSFASFPGQTNHATSQYRTSVCNYTACSVVPSFLLGVCGWGDIEYVNRNLWQTHVCCACVHSCVSMWACWCEGLKLTSGVFLNCFSTNVYWSRVSYWAQSSLISTRIDSQLTPGTPCLFLCRDYGRATMPAQLWCEPWGSELWYSFHLLSHLFQQ